MTKSNLREVARQAGVSSMTASRILNGRTQQHHAETVERVRQAARNLDYQPNLLGRALVGGRTQSIGVIIRAFGGRLAVRRLSTATQAAKAAGYLAYVVNLRSAGQDDSDDLIEAARELIGRRVDGLLISRSVPVSKQARQFIANHAPPTVWLDWGPPRGAHRVILDRESAARAMATHLRELGHRRAALLPTPDAMHFIEHRIEPYRRACAAADLELEVVTCQSTTPASAHETFGYDQVQRLLGERGADLPALLMHNDEMALGALLALREAGLRVPEDVSIAGWDDLPLARFTDPPLTTVRGPTEAAGQAAFDVLRTLIEDRAPAGETRARTRKLQRTMRCELVVRQSTGPAPALKTDQGTGRPAR